jgi:hypothetical protein
MYRLARIRKVGTSTIIAIPSRLPDDRMEPHSGLGLYTKRLAARLFK